MKYVTLYWFLESKITGASVSVGDYLEVLAERDRIADEARENGRSVTFYNRKRIMVIRNGDQFDRFTVKRVRVPETSIK